MTNMAELSGLLVGIVALSGIVPLLKSSWGSLCKDSQDFGVVLAIALRLGLFEAKGLVDDVREHFIKGDGGLDQAMAFKDSYTPTFNMVGVAGAILAQIALTALDLPNLDDTHWMARASFVMGLVAGSLAVFCSCVLQSKMSTLRNPHAVRKWLTRPREKWAELRYINDDQAASTLEYTNLDSTNLADKQQMLFRFRERFKERFNEKVYRPSLSAALILTAPSQLLNIALGSLLTGFGIYFGFVYSAKLPAIKDNRSALAVLAVYITTAASGLLLFYFPILIKLVAALRDRRDDDIYRVIDGLERVVQASEQAEAASKQDGILSALTKIIIIQDKQLQLQKDFQVLLESRLHPPGYDLRQSIPS